MEAPSCGFSPVDVVGRRGFMDDARVDDMAKPDSSTKSLSDTRL